MPTVDLSIEEWQQMMALISEGPWRVANPLLMKLTAQLQHQSSKQQTTNSEDMPMNSGDPASSRAN
jgi:hypothetical protein